MIEQFHFLRPLWLLVIVPALIIATLLWRSRSSDANWRRAVAPELLTHLLDDNRERRQHWPWWLACAGWILSCIAMAGPVWEKLPQPVLQNRDALVIVFDLSLSMTAEDVQPSRLQRARFKILDVLARRHEGLTGLVVYAGDAHIVTPLTDDTATIENMVPALAPNMMPLYGSRVGEGIELAIELLKNSEVTRGHILLISDGIEPSDIDPIRAQLRATSHRLSILGVGTEQGAPIPIEGGFLKQRDGSIVIPQLRGELLQQLASANNGIYRSISVGDDDINALLPSALPDSDSLRLTERDFDQWRERGPLLVALLLPLAALAFRRGWLLLAMAALLLLPDARSFAADSDPSAVSAASPSANSWIDQSKEVWRNLWKTPDQQAADALARGDAKTAAQKFTDPAWQASALYRAGDYEKAAQSFQTLRDDEDKIPADADYNRGNALARAGQLEAALHAYDEALQKDSALADAKANRDLVKKLLEQQQNTQSDASAYDQQADSSQSSQDGQQKESSGQQNTSQHNQGEAQSQSQSQQHGERKDQQQDSTSASGQQPENDEEKSLTQSQENRAGNENNTDATRASEQQSQQSEQQLTPEQQRQQQAMEQWLRQIPDDPSGLLRRKFDYENRQRARRDTREGDGPLW